MKVCVLHADLSSTHYSITGLSPSSCPGSLLVGWGSPAEPALGVLGRNRALGFGVKGAPEVEVGERSPRHLRPGPAWEQPGRQEQWVAVLRETCPDTLPAPRRRSLLRFNVRTTSIY